MTSSAALHLPHQDASPRLPARNIALSLLMLCLFFLYSRIFDLVLTELHVTVLTFWLAVVAAIFSGGALRAFSNKLGALLILYYTWLLLVTPFSVWKGGSAEVMKASLKIAPIFLVIAGIVLTFEDLRRAMAAFAYAILTLALLSFVFATLSDSGRLMFDRGRFSNPNDLAQIMLLALPFWYFRVTNHNLSRLRRIFASMAMLVLMVVLARTGSRGALVALVVVGFMMFVTVSMGSKVRLALLGLVFAVASTVLLPSSVKQRYLTFFGSEQESAVTLSDELALDATVTSTYARRELLLESIRLTLEHPLFGVGPGQFPVAQSMRAEAKGERGLWHVTHNTYTQISSEAGLPALFIFVAALIIAFRRVTFYRRAAQPGAPPEIAEISNAAFALRLSLTGYAVFALFGSFAYDAVFPTLAAFVVALDNVASGPVASWNALRRARVEINGSLPSLKTRPLAATLK